MCQHGDYQQVFQQFDLDGDGRISPSELRACVRATTGEDLSLEDAEALVASADSDGDGLFGYDDFAGLVEVGCEEERDRRLNEAFGVYETEGLGCITAASLKRALSGLGRSRGIDECEAMICRFDLNGDGVLSFEEFRVMMLC